MRWFLQRENERGGCSSDGGRFGFRRCSNFVKSSRKNTRAKEAFSIPLSRASPSNGCSCRVSSSSEREQTPALCQLQQEAASSSSKASSSVITTCSTNVVASAGAGVDVGRCCNCLYLHRRRRWNQRRASPSYSSFRPPDAVRRPPIRPLEGKGLASGLAGRPGRACGDGRSVAFSRDGGNSRLLFSRCCGQHDESGPRGRQRSDAAGAGRVSEQGRDRAQALDRATRERSDGARGVSEQEIRPCACVLGAQAVPRGRGREE